MSAAQGSLGALAMVLLAGAATAEEPVEPYQPPGCWAWDFWFIRHQDVYHAFYLEAPQCLGDERLTGEHKWVGHATSTDLLHWTYQGPALVAVRHTWNDLSIATGSTFAYDGKFWMIYTGHSSTRHGLGLAVSDDLMHWTKVGDGPVIPLDQPFDGEWEGLKLQWRGLADPYVYPEPVDGWFYLLLNSQVVGEPIQTSGCLTMLRSRDLLSWEPHAVITWPRYFERLETPQLWRHDGRWYLYFGGAHDHGLPAGFLTNVPEGTKPWGMRGNYVFTSDRLEGPYLPSGKYWLDLPDGQWGYIAKVLSAPDGGEVLLVTLGGRRLSLPYALSYAADGSLQLGPAPEREP